MTSHVLNLAPEQSHVFRGGSLLRRVEHHTDDVAVVEVQLRVNGVEVLANPYLVLQYFSTSCTVEK